MVSLIVSVTKVSHLAEEGKEERQERQAREQRKIKKHAYRIKDEGDEGNAFARSERGGRFEVRDVLVRRIAEVGHDSGSEHLFERLKCQT